MKTTTTIIKATKRKDMWNYVTNEPLPDTTPIGFVMETEGLIPESWIKYVPNKVFDRRKYPELYLLFGKDHLPNELELKCFVQKHFDEWHTKKPSKWFTFGKICVDIAIGALCIIISLYALTLIFGY